MRTFTNTAETAQKFLTWAQDGDLQLGGRSFRYLKWIRAQFDAGRSAAEVSTDLAEGRGPGVGR